MLGPIHQLSTPPTLQLRLQAVAPVFGPPEVELYVRLGHSLTHGRGRSGVRPWDSAVPQADTFWGWPTARLSL